MILLVMGIIMMFSAGYAWAIAEGGTGTDYVQNQIIMANIIVLILNVKRVLLKV